MTHVEQREGIAYSADPTPNPIRYHYMDNLRALAMLTGIFFHAALAYSPLLSQLWLTADSQTSIAMDAFAWFTHLFRMPLFFLIAGFFTCYLVDRRGVSGMLKNRMMRVALPFVLFLPLVWWSLGAGIGWAITHVQNPSSMLQLISYMATVPDAPPPPATTTYLWFLYNLFQFYLVYALLSKTGLLEGRWTRILTTPKFIVVALPLLMVPALLTVAAPAPAPEQFMPQAWSFGFFGLFFLLGSRLFRDPEAITRLKPWAPWLLAMSIVLYGVLFSMFPKSVTLEQAMATTAGIPFSWRHLGMSVLEAIVAVHMTIVCLVVGQSLLDRANKAMRLVADSSYWVYIIHLPVLFMVQYLLLDVNWNLWTKFACASLGTLAIGFVSYLLLVRWTPIGWLLNGRRGYRQHHENRGQSRFKLKAQNEIGR